MKLRKRSSSTRIEFVKYQGSGNDFVLIQDFDRTFPCHNLDLIERLALRKWGIGADGLILIQRSDLADLKMSYFNADGSRAPMCGNGLRCLFHYACEMGWIAKSAAIETDAGIVQGRMLEDGRIANSHTFSSAIETVDLKIGEKTYPVSLVDSGVPHALHLTENLKDFPVEEVGRIVRHHPHFAPGGTNATFFEIIDGETLGLRTYERGVEGETLSCGSAALAVALFVKQVLKWEKDAIILLPSSCLPFEVRFGREIELIGRAEETFRGSVSLVSLEKVHGQTS